MVTILTSWCSCPDVMSVVWRRRAEPRRSSSCTRAEAARRSSASSCVSAAPRAEELLGKGGRATGISATCCRDFCTEESRAAASAICCESIRADPVPAVCCADPVPAVRCADPVPAVCCADPVPAVCCESRRADPSCTARAFFDATSSFLTASTIPMTVRHSPIACSNKAGNSSPDSAIHTE